MNTALMTAGRYLAYTPPSTATTQLDMVLGWIAWLVTAAGVAGLTIVGMRMAVALKTGDAEEHVKEYLIVLGACVIASCAGPIVQFVGIG